MRFSLVRPSALGAWRPSALGAWVASLAPVAPVAPVALVALIALVAFVASSALVACGRSAPPSAPSVSIPASSARAVSPVASVAPEAALGHEDAIVPVLASDPVWGRADAPLTLVEFSDLQCPFCARAAVTVAELQKHYGPEQLRVVWKHAPLPFHVEAAPAAEAAVVVHALRGSDAFWAFEQRAFTEQRELGSERYVRWAGELGIQSAEFSRLLVAGAGKKKVEQDLELGKKLGVNGTPQFFVNGIRISGAQPYATFTAVMDQELVKVKAKLTLGTPIARIYVERSLENFQASPKEDEDDAGEDTKVYRVPVGKSPVRGDPTARVTIVEFGDFECPFCKRVQESLEKVQKHYGRDVRIVWKHAPLPFHKQAEPAAEFAIEARAQKGDAGFWAAHDALFDTQAHFTQDDLDRLAGKLGLDKNRMRVAIAKKKHAAAIEDDASLAEDIRAVGTPHFFINGRRLVGARPFEQFRALIDAELAKANKLLESGVPADKVYEKTIASGVGSVIADAKTVSIAIPHDAPLKGSQDAKVVMQIFGDYQCPFCKRAESTVQALMARYPGKLRIVWRHLPLPFHTDAPLAAEAAVEAFEQRGHAAFWKMHDKLMAAGFGTPGKERAPGESELARVALERYAKEIGLDVPRFQGALDSRKHKARVEADASAAAAADIRGTPTFVIGGYVLTGAQNELKFRKLIDRVLQDGPATAR